MTKKKAEPTTFTKGHIKYEAVLEAYYKLEEIDYHRITRMAEWLVGFVKTAHPENEHFNFIDALVVLASLGCFMNKEQLAA